MTSFILPAKSDHRQPIEPRVQIDETALAIFDSRVDDLPLLLAGLRPGVSAHVLDPNRDGIEQISELVRQHPTTSLTLVAHGAPGELQLGADKLQLANLNTYTQHLKSWFRTADAARLTLLACQVAAGDAGTEFVAGLAELTGAVVTAAATVVGNGQWPPVATQTFRQSVLDTYSATLVLTFKQAIKDGSLDGGDPDVNRLFGTSGVTVSPDGTQVFVTSAIDASLTVFNLDAFGNLTFSQVIRDSFEVDELFGAFGVAVSPDGSQVFVASTGDNSLTVFSRDSAGILTEQQLLKDGRGDIEALEGATDVAIAPDGSQVYVVSSVDSALTVLDRDESGNLTFRQAIVDDFGGANELFGASGVAVSPDGSQVFVTSQDDAAITVFDRDASGNLSFRQAIKDGQNGVEHLFGASGVVVSPDGNQVYVASAVDAAITVFDRNADGTLSFAQVVLDGDDGAELFGGTGGTGIVTVDGFTGISISPDGNQVFVTSFGDSAITVFNRDAAGRLTVDQVIQDQDGVNGANELAGAIGAVVSPNNQQVFVVSTTDNALTVFNRDLAPNLLSITRQTPATTETDADTLVFRVTFSESIQNITATDFTVSGGSTATVSNITAVSATAYDITVSGGDLADFNGIVGLDLAAGQDITDPIGNSLPTTEPTIDETYSLVNETIITPNKPAQLTPLSGLEITGLGTDNTLRLHVQAVDIASVGEIRIIDVNGANRTQIGEFFLLEGGRLPAAYRPAFSIDSSQVSEGQFLEFQLVVDGTIQLATPAVISATEVALNFGEGTQLTVETFTQTATTNLLVNDAAAIDLTGQTGVVNVDFTVYREAALNSTIGFYTTDLIDGGIRDPLTGNTLQPGDAGYKEAALANRLDIELTGKNNQVSTFSAELAAGGFLAIFLVADGGNPATGEVFFSHAGANNNNDDHARLLGDNMFGFEDLSGLGDRDYNDMVVEFSLG
ncbi:3-carboxymuconate cyclase [Leptolyngbya sp. Heron Island J]|uniref:DUF4347 domain-containing protein n=1 Tax=Leptolyngbya sp. Heron Island J TaxID=1385935 RepID=UPI0003B9787A|nr:DUF4347 domain-containing protein [Leptolyngbya sp. Heron Island J]ESA33336.1 3-carboxymuconate cyclase [Leptolyngbya sp. Heron Island J]